MMSNRNSVHYELYQLLHQFPNTTIEPVPYMDSRLDILGLCHANVMKHQVETFSPQNPLTKGYGNREKWLELGHKIVNGISGDRHKLLKEREIAASSKFGPQGGDTPLPNIAAICKTYYYVPSSVDVSGITDGVHFLIKLFKNTMEKVGPPLVYEYSSAFKHTFGGSPVGLPKGNYYTETIGVPILNVRHAAPAIPGVRKQRNSIRAIFQDGTGNVRQLEWIVNACSLWLKTNLPYLFSGWLNPELQLRPMATRVVEEHYATLGLDFTKCDQHTSLQLVQQIVNPLMRVLLDDSAYIVWELAVEELFHQPLFLGSWLVHGEHTLFSGQVITNFVETLIDLAAMIAVVLRHGGSKVVACSMFFANGDDQVLALPAKLADRVPVVAEDITEAYNRAGHIMNTEKETRLNGRMVFCKLLYQNGYPRNGAGHLLGAYPLMYALNSIVNPEVVGATPGQELVACLQRLDNAAGHPYHHDFVTMVGSRLDKGVNFDEVDVAITLSRDWWYQLYGVPWTPDQSISFNILKARNLI